MKTGNAVLLLPLAIALSAPADRALAGDPAPFNAYVQPATRNVLLGDSVQVTFEVDSTGVQFNAFDVLISYESAYLTLLSVEEGDLVTSSGCDSWWVTDPTASAVRATGSLLCSGGSLDGPGVLARIWFRADAVGVSPLVIQSPPDRTFADDGLWVAPTHPSFPRQVIFTDGVVEVVDETTSVGSGGHVVPGVRVRFAPNPTRGPGVFVLDTAGRADQLLVLDAVGRIVWRKTVGAGAERVSWDGRTSGGDPVAPGVYFYRLARDAGPVGERLVVLP